MMRTFLDVFPETTLWPDDTPLVEYHRSLPADDRPVDLAGWRGDVSPRVRR